MAAIMLFPTNLIKYYGQTTSSTKAIAVKLDQQRLALLVQGAMLRLCWMLDLYNAT